MGLTRGLDASTDGDTVPRDRGPDAARGSSQVSGDYEVALPGETSFRLAGAEPAIDFDVRLTFTGSLEGSLTARVRIPTAGRLRDATGDFTAAGRFEGIVASRGAVRAGSFRATVRGRMEPDGSVGGRLAVEHGEGVFEQLEGAIELRGRGPGAGTYRGRIAWARRGNRPTAPPDGRGGTADAMDRPGPRNT